MSHVKFLWNLPKKYLQTSNLKTEFTLVFEFLYVFAGWLYPPHFRCWLSFVVSMSKILVPNLGRHLVDAKLAYIPESYDSILGSASSSPWAGRFFCLGEVPTLCTPYLYFFIFIIWILQNMFFFFLKQTQQQTHRANPLPLEEGPWKDSFHMGCWELG